MDIGQSLEKGTSDNAPRWHEVVAQSCQVFDEDAMRHPTPEADILCHVGHVFKSRRLRTEHSLDGNLPTVVVAGNRLRLAVNAENVLAPRLTFSRTVNRHTLKNAGSNTNRIGG